MLFVGMIKVCVAWSENCFLSREKKNPKLLTADLTFWTVFIQAMLALCTTGPETLLVIPRGKCPLNGTEFRNHAGQGRLFEDAYTFEKDRSHS